MRELNLNEMKLVSGGNLKEKDVIRDEGILWDTCYAKKKDGTKGARVKCP